MIFDLVAPPFAELSISLTISVLLLFFILYSILKTYFILLINENHHIYRFLGLDRYNNKVDLKVNNYFVNLKDRDPKKQFI
jgi:hypothetical protein